MKKSIIFILAAFVLMSMSSCYYTWSPDKKQNYQFTLLEREFMSHPEKLDKSVLMIITDHEGRVDTILSAEVDKLMSYPSAKKVEVVAPYGGPYKLILTCYEGGWVYASISKTIWDTKIVFNEELSQNTGEGGVRKQFIVGERSWPYIYGKKGTGLIPKSYDDNEYNEATFEALSKMKKIIQNI